MIFNCRGSLRPLTASKGGAVGGGSQERKRYINLRRILRTPAGCPCQWDTRRDNTVYRPVRRRCPRDPLLFTIAKLTGKGIFAGHRLDWPRDTRPSTEFPETLCHFFVCLSISARILKKPLSLSLSLEIFSLALQSGPPATVHNV